MDTILATNILFYILSFFFLLLTIGFIIWIIYVIKILKSILAFLAVIKEEAEKITQDIEAMKEKVKGGGAVFKSIALHILSFLKKPEKKSKK